MAGQFVLCLNRQGKIRLEKWYNDTSLEERGPIIGKVFQCVQNHVRKDTSNIIPFEYKYKLVFKQYNGLFVIIGIEESDNELVFLQSIPVFIKVLDTYFDTVSEMDLIFEFPILYKVLNLMFYKGEIIELNQDKLLTKLKEISVD